MSEELLGLSITQWLAVYGSVVSTLAILVTLWTARRDRGKLRITGMVGVPFGGGIKDSGLSKSRRVLAFRIANVGRRPVRVNGIAGRLSWWSRKNAIVFFPELPKLLSEGNEVVVCADSFEFLDQDPVSIYAYDSAGRQYLMSRSDLRSLKKSYAIHKSRGVSKE